MSATAVGRRYALTIAKLAISSLLLWWLWRQSDPDGLRASLSRLESRWVFIALLLILAQTLTLGWRWHRIIARLGGRWPAGAAMRWCFIGVFFNQALPSSVGGDVVRVWAMQRDGVPPELSFGSVVIERATGLAVLGLVVSASTAWIAPTLEGGWIVTALLLSGPAALVALAVATTLHTVVTCFHPNRGVQAEAVDVGAQRLLRCGLARHALQAALALCMREPFARHGTVRRDGPMSTLSASQGQHLAAGAGPEGDAIG